MATKTSLKQHNQKQYHMEYSNSKVQSTALTKAEFSINIASDDSDEADVDGVAAISRHDTISDEVQQQTQTRGVVAQQSRTLQNRVDERGGGSSSCQ